MEHTQYFPLVEGFRARLRFGRSMRGQFLWPALALTLALLGMLVFVTATRAAPLLDAPWNPNVQVNDDTPGLANQHAPALAASKTSDDVFALWQDSRNDDGDIYFAHSPDGGQTWKASIRVNHDVPGLTQSAPDIALGGSGILHAVWADSRAGTMDIYYSRSTDNGTTWSNEVRVNDVFTGVQQTPAIAALGNKVCIVWEDGRVAYARNIYADCSTDGGSTWGTDTRVNNDEGAFTHYLPDVALGADGRVHIVWYDNRGGTWDIYYTYLSPAGSANVCLNDATAGMQQYPAIAANGNTVQVVWVDYGSGSAYILGDISTDGGATWGKDQPVSESGNAMEPDVAFDGQGTAWATWRVPTTTYPVYADAYGPNGWSADMLVYDSKEYLLLPAIAAGAKQVYVAWEHYFETDADVLLAIWDGSEWTGPVQINDDGDAWQANPAIAIGSTGQLYAAWGDKRTNAYGYVLYADTSLDGGATWGTDVRVDDNHPLQGAPAIGTTGPLTVHVVWSSMQYDTGAVYYDRSANGGQTWGVDRLLNPAGGYGVGGPPDLATYGTQKIFVVWARYDGLWFVSSLDGGSTWISPTIILTATGSIESPAIAVDATGRLHLAWVEMPMQTNEQRIAYAHSTDDGSTWADRQYVDGGTPRTSRANPDIAVNPVNGYVHLVWDDDRTGTRTVFHNVSADQGATWGTPAGVVAGPAIEPTIAVDGDGVVYVLWQNGLEGNTDIFYTTSLDDGASWSVPGRVNDDATVYPQQQPAVVAGNSAYAVWSDFRRVNWDIQSAGLVLACPVPLQGVTITGPTETRTGVPVQLTAKVTPTNASLPLTFVWIPTPAQGQGTPQAIYYWQKPGTYPVQVRASNCGGVFTATHNVAVVVPTPRLPCVEGRITYAITPLAGVQVELLAGSSGRVLQSTTTNADGYYRFCNLEPGDYMLKRYGPSAEYADWVADSLTMGSSNVIKNLDLPKKMTLLSPGNGELIDTRTPTMTWQALPEAGRYTFQLNKTADWTLVEHTNNIVGTAHRVLAPLDLNTGYTWQIDAYTGTHWVGMTAHAFTFTTPMAVILPPPPIVTINSSLRLEEAAEGVVVNKLIGDDTGKTFNNYVDVVAYVSTQSADAASDVQVVLTVPDDALGAPVNTWVRDSYGGTPTSVTSVALGGGRYGVTTTLTRGCFWWFCPYRKYVVWRFRIPNTLTPQTLSLMSRVYRPGYWVFNSFSHARLRLVSTAGALIVTNRAQLYDNYTDYEVTSLLARLYDVAQGAPYNDQPLGVVYNADLYDTDVRNWNNAAVNYTNEATANAVANELDELINDWVEDGTWTWSYHYFFSTTVSTDIYPYYLLLVGDDDVLPFYRYNDPYNDESGWTVTSATNPQIRATDNDYILTDAPYAYRWGGTGWQLGDLDLAVGRLVGATADDMLYLLNNSLATDGGTWRAVMASVDGWELGYNNPSCGAGAVADVLNVPARLGARGFQVLNDTETPHTVDVMEPFDANWINGFSNAANAGMDIFFIGGHNSYNSAGIPGNSFTPDDTCSSSGCRYNHFDDDHPLTFIVGCHGGLPVPNIGGRGGINDNMVYDVIHEGGRAYVGATGYSYGSPGSLCHATWGEKLLQHFFDEFLKAGTESRTIGDALRRAKDVYPFGQYNPGTSATDGDALDRKTVTEFNLYGVPWQRLDYPGGTMNQRISESASVGRPSAVRVNGENIAQADTYRYTRTVTIDIAAYQAGQVITGSVTYDVLSIAGGEMAVAPNLPMLPYVKGYTLTLPVSATVQSVSLVTATCSDVGPYEIPIIVAQPWSEGGTTFTTTTTINTFYPADANRVVGQMQDGRMLFTLFPIQHNPTSNATRFCSQMVIEVVYDAPVALAVSHVTPLAALLRPGAPISVTALLENVTDELLTVTSTLTLLDAQGHEVGWQNGGPFSVPADGQQAVEVGWDGLLSEGMYGLLLTFWKDGVLMGMATSNVNVVGGALTALEVPTATLTVSDTATFRVTFANYRTGAVTATAHLQLFDSESGLVATLPPQTTVVVGGANHTFTFVWEVPTSVGGVYVAQARIVRDADTAYGPLTGEFTIASPIKEIFLPLVLRNS